MEGRSSSVLDGTKNFPSLSDLGFDCLGLDGDLLLVLLSCEAVTHGKRVKTLKQIGQLCASHSMPRSLQKASILVLQCKGQPTHQPGV